MNKNEFEKPALRYRMKTIIHEWPQKSEVLMAAIRHFGYGGTATNPATKNGYTSNAENLKEFGKILAGLKEQGLEYWIYDEKGYPSGYAGGLALDGHPELEAKGFYMIRRIAYKPRHCAQESADCLTDRSTLSLTRRIYEQGHDYLFADREDLVAAAKSLAGGTAWISGIRVRNILLPAMDVIWQDAWEALIELRKSGVNVWFADQLPAYRVEQRQQFHFYDFREEAVRGPKRRRDEFFCAMSEEDILQMLTGQEHELTLCAATVDKAENEAADKAGNIAAGEAAQDIMLLKARFVKDGKIIYLIVNNSEADAEVSWHFAGRDWAEIWDPADGTTSMAKAGAKTALASYRGTFLVFEA